MIVVAVSDLDGMIISVLQFDSMPDKDDLISDPRAHKYYRVVGRVYNIPEGFDQRVVEGVLYCVECPVIPYRRRMTK